MALEIKEFIQFMNFNSKNEKLYMIERDAPTPEEKEIIKDLPFSQGVLDFSALLGERIFKNREIKYKFRLFNTPYSERKFVERRIKQRLMLHNQQKLFETHNVNYYWLGKCKSVEVENDYKFNGLLVTIVFNCYPFLIGEKNKFDDNFNELYDNPHEVIANYTKYEVNGKLKFPLFNAGSVSIKPTITADSNFKVTVNEDTANITSGDNSDYYLSLRPGVNDVTVEGYGTIYFHFRKEVMA